MGTVWKRVQFYQSFSFTFLINYKFQETMNISGGICLAFIIISLCGQNTSADTLTITSIKCIAPSRSGLEFLPNFSASDVDSYLEFVGALATATAPVALASGGAAVPLVVGITAATQAQRLVINQFMDFIDDHILDFTGEDELCVNIDGQKVWPLGADSEDIDAGETKTLNPPIKYDFQDNFEVTFWDHDTLSDDDLTGKFKCPTPCEAIEDEAFVVDREAGSTFMIHFKIEKNSKGGGEQWMLCGTENCAECDRPNCPNSDGPGLDRDKDVEDLRNCPSGFKNEGTKLFEDSVPIFGVDQFLRICSKNA